MPSCLIEHNNRVGAGIDFSADQRQMLVHRVSVGIWHDQPGALALCGTDRAEDIGGFRPLVLGRRGARAAPRPASGDLVLLADARFILPPQLDLYARVEARPDLRQLGGEAFLKPSTAHSF